MSASTVYANEITCLFNSSVSGLQEKVTKPLDISKSFNEVFNLHGQDKSHFASMALDGFIYSNGDTRFTLHMDVWEPSKPASRRATSTAYSVKLNDLAGGVVFVTDQAEEYSVSCRGF